jgi:hypothetical protein
VTEELESPSCGADGPRPQLLPEVDLNGLEVRDGPRRAVFTRRLDELDDDERGERLEQFESALEAAAAFADRVLEAEFDPRPGAPSSSRRAGFRRPCAS